MRPVSRNVRRHRSPVSANVRRKEPAIARPPHFDCAPLYVLGDLGYAAIEAADGASGLRVLQSDARVDLLVTDVGLPGGMNGRQLADAARTGRPGLKVLFITGFAETALSNNGQMDLGMAVLTKPFAVDALAARVREMIAK